MRVIVACEKYGTRYLDASTDEAWAKSGMKLLCERYENGYYPSSGDIYGQIMGLIMRNDLGFHTKKDGTKTYPKCWGILENRSEYEYESVSIEEVETNDN